MNAFIITFDTDATPIYSAHNAIVKSPYMIEWWHFMNGTYIVTTNQSISVLNKDIRSRWPGGNLLIMKASKQSAGLLPRQAWDWINSRITI